MHDEREFGNKKIAMKAFTPADNTQKYENYREQFNRLKRALTSKFYLEAIFIEYTIIEDRTESILHHAGMWEKCVKKQRGRFLTLKKRSNISKRLPNAC